MSRRSKTAESTSGGARPCDYEVESTVGDAKTEERLRRSEMLLAQAEQLANTGSWELDVTKKTLVWSAHFFRLLELEPGRIIPHEMGMLSIHPDDRERARRDLDVLISTGEPLDHVLRFITASGSVRLFHSRAIAITDKKGKIALVRGMSQDITESRAAEIKVRESESLLSYAEEIAHLGSWEFDVGSATPRLSKNLRAMYGLTENEEFNREIYTERLHPRDRTRVRRIIDEATAACQPFEFQTRYVLPTGETRFLFTRGVPVAAADGKSARVLGVVQDITDAKRAQDDVRRLWRQMIQGRDEERRRMARELHESAGQSLAALKMSLSRLHESLPKNKRLVETLWRSSVELADAAVREVRTVSYLMHPPLLDEAGLGPALRWYARGFAERSKIAVSVDIADDFGRASQEVETTVFRVVQEALTNVHRYSGSSTACIRIWREGGLLFAEVKDEGCGLGVAARGVASEALPGVGIAGMRERVQHLHGAFDIESMAGRGTIVRVTLPLAGAADEALCDEEAAEKLA